MNVECWAFLLLIISTLSLCAQTDTNPPPKLIPAYGEMPETFWEQNESTIIVAGSAFLAFAILFLKVMLRPVAPAILPPEVVAREALSKLQSQPEDGKLLSGVSQILRRYIAAAFELPHAEMTTAEFTTVLATNEKIGLKLSVLILNFLRECDERKFSASTAATPFNAVTRALELISLTEQQRRQSPPASSATSLEDGRIP